MRWKVQWNSDGGDRVRLQRSTYWTTNGYVVAASPAMQWAVGLPDEAVARWVYWRDHTLKADGFECVPHTVSYHRQLKKNVDALLALLEKPEKEETCKAKTQT